MSDLIEVVIDSIRVSLMSQQRIVILREIHAERYLPIWIGAYEADAITIALQEVEVSRPLTHDLIKIILRELGARVIRVEVSSLRDDTFFGSIIVDHNGETIHIDARPSDAIALAVRTHVPIMVNREVLNIAGLMPEKDLQSEKSAPSSENEQPGQNAPEADTNNRLSIFDDFISKLDTDDPDKGQPKDSL